MIIKIGDNMIAFFQKNTWHLKYIPFSDHRTMVSFYFVDVNTVKDVIFGLVLQMYSQDSYRKPQKVKIIKLDPEKIGYGEEGYSLRLLDKDEIESVIDTIFEIYQNVVYIE